MKIKIIKIKIKIIQIKIKNIQIKILIKITLNEQIKIIRIK